jgi:hypothetical protein
LDSAVGAYHPSTLVREFDQTGNAALHLTDGFVPLLSKKKQPFTIDEVERDVSAPNIYLPAAETPAADARPYHLESTRRLAAVSKSSEARSYLMNPTGELHAVVRNFRFARHSEVKLCQSFVR